MGIVLTLLAALVTALEGHYPVSLLFLVGTAVFAAESVGTRLRHAALIVRGAQDVLDAPDETPVRAAGGSRPRRHRPVASGADTDPR
jgi:hypothetical protein